MHGRTLAAAEDLDRDGYSNYMESLWGSDPLDAQSPGDLQFTIQGSQGQIRVPNEVGLRYRIVHKSELADPSWTEPAAFTVSDGTTPLRSWLLPSSAQGFFRIELAEPLHSDGDGLNDWEEATLGTDPLLADTDDDLLDDAVETMVAGSDPHKVDSDDDGFVDRDEHLSGSDPSDPKSWPPEITQNPWSQPVTIVNDAAPIGSMSEVWSQAVTIQNTAAPVEGQSEIWSAPVSVQNDALAVGLLDEVWSAPIVILNTYSTGG
ncbi:hypothetical protein [Coraliomargarita akajimensis]|uniref:hypothetical protein n=1 Tax=Coraliomargarita akajimensis TaxID=395922 RepID=UPI0011D03CF6|nr:hypothetical protein [Coraliomargarita akajimensis]